MPTRNGDPALRAAEPAPADRKCPKCGTETEPIEIAAAGLPIEELQLCPACYLVTWRDLEGFHIRQGLPVKEDAVPDREPDGSFYTHPKLPASC